MSEVISFRLNKDNPRKDQALMILKTWCAEGFIVRHVMTDALLRLNDAGSKQTDITLDKLKLTLDQVNQFLEQFDNRNPIQMRTQDGNPSNLRLPDSVITSVKKSVKLGMKLS
ncbi:hypothetical protein ACFLV7_15545 [Chloroflexota bacterium]